MTWVVGVNVIRRVSIISRDGVSPKSILPAYLMYCAGARCSARLTGMAADIFSFVSFSNARRVDSVC